MPAICVGLLGKAFDKQFKFIMNDTMLAGICFVVTGFMLLMLKIMKSGNQEYRELSWRQALGVGIFQAVGILPGISRSGATIVGGSYCGLRQQSAATFSFLLAIPAIFLASCSEGMEMMKHPASTPLWLLIMGASVSFLVGLVALKLLVRLIEVGRLYVFSYYLLPLGLAVLSWRYYVEFIH